MANVQTRGENTERVVIKTESGAERGIGTISYTPSGVDVSLDLKCPTIPDNLDPAEEDHSSYGASESPSSSAAAETSASIPSSTPPADSSNTTAGDPSACSNSGSDATSTDLSGDTAETEQPTDSNSPANGASTSEPASDTHEAEEAESDTSSEGASSDDLSQDNPSESSDTTSSPAPSSAPSDAATPDPSKTETETSSEGSKQSTGTVNNEYIPTSIQNQEALESWINARQKDQAQTPTKPIRQIELVSWLQVPEIIRALSNNEGPLRITYPDCSDTNITAEQQAIRDFLVQGAGEDLKDLTGKLEEKIKNCHFVTTGIVTEQVAQAYRTSIALENSSTTKLTVAEVIRTNEHFMPNKVNKNASMRKPAKEGRALILGAITDTMAKSSDCYTLIIEVPEEHRDVAKWAFADYYNKLAEEQKPDAQYTKVWILPSRESTEDIEESPFRDFIKNPPDMGQKRKSSPRNTSSSRTQLGAQQLGNNSN